jgi:hypothetical protein
MLDTSPSVNDEEDEDRDQVPNDDSSTGPNTTTDEFGHVVNVIDGRRLKSAMSRKGNRPKTSKYEALLNFLWKVLTPVLQSCFLPSGRGATKTKGKEKGMHYSDVDITFFAQLMVVCSPSLLLQAHLQYSFHWSFLMIPHLNCGKMKTFERYTRSFVGIVCAWYNREHNKANVGESTCTF